MKDHLKYILKCMSNAVLGQKMEREPLYNYNVFILSQTFTEKHYPHIPKMLTAVSTKETHSNS